MNILRVAALVQDAYYKEFPKDSDFFKLDDFQEFAYVGFAAALQDDFDKTLAANKSGMDLSINSQWFITETRKVENEGGQYFIKDVNVFAFQKDGNMTGVRYIEPTGPCGDIAKTSIEKVRSLSLLPASDKTIYCYLENNKLIFKRVSCGLDSVNISYIPNGGDCIEVPDGLVETVIAKAMNAVKASEVVDKTNDQNPNSTPQTER